MRQGPDAKWIGKALELAAKARGVSPNPLVGCVIVKGGRAVAEGYHKNFGGPHAEIIALKKLKDARGSTLYCNLEPCCHWGKTGPCTDAIIQAGVSRVVASMTDPNAIVGGKGFAQLRKAGVRVSVGIGRAEAQDLNRTFIKFITRRKPYVYLKAAMSLDGKTATRTGRSKWITGVPARMRGYEIRADVDAVMVGAGTIRKDDPSLTSHGLGRNPVRVVVSSAGDLPLRSKIFNAASRTWIIHGNASDKTWARGSAEWIYVKSRGGRLDFNDVLLELGRRGVSRLLVEGGPETLGWASDSRQVDECLFFVAPKILGGASAQSAVGGQGAVELKNSLEFKKMEAEKIGSDVLIRARN